MTKIKTFSICTYDNGDEAINQFIKDKKIIDVKMCSHQCGNNPPKFFLDYVVIYEDDSED